MSLYGMMRTGVSGMGAQASRLGTVSDNIANADTTGYKRSGTQFSTLVLPGTAGSYESGGVNANVNYAIDQQGGLQYTTSNTDLAINGDGFFVVQNGNGQPFLTRAGSFTPDASGNLVNAAGFTLLGYDASSGPPTTTANGYAGLVPVNTAQNDLTATASTAGSFTANLPSGAEAGDVEQSSLVTYDSLGNEKLVNLTFTKSADDNTWTVAGTNADDDTSLGDPVTLTFDPASGQLSSTGNLALTIPGGRPVNLDLSRMTQLATGFTVRDAQVNGNGPSKLTDVSIGNDGTVSAQYDDGTISPLYRIAMADVPSPDNMQPLPGNVYQATTESGDVQIGFAGSGSFGTISSGALESSNVDIGTELTEMISSQRSYTANSKVFQTGSDLLNILVNLQR